MNLFDYLARHPTAADAARVLCLAVSVSLIVHVWLAHPRDPFGKKLLWSFILLVPLLGWCFYAGLYHLPGVSDSPAQPNNDA